jgi:hypothetical protein
MDANEPQTTDTAQVDRENVPDGDQSAAAKDRTAATGNADQAFSWRLALVLTAAVVGLGFLGFALTNYAPQGASWYWVVILPAFAAIGIWQTWSTVRKEGRTNWPLVRKQIYHWLALFVAIKILFVLIYSGNIDREDGGLVALLLMALTCTLVGVNFNWIFIAIGVLLGAGVLVAGCFREYIWLTLLGLGLATVLLLALQRLARRKKTN